MDGKIIIGVDLETKKLNENLNKLQKKLESEEKNLDLKFGDLEYAREELKKTAQELDKIKKKRDEINQKIASKQKQYTEYSAMDQMNPEIRARTGYLAGSIEKLKMEQGEINSQFDTYNQKLNVANDNLVKSEISYEKQKNKVDEINNEIDKTKQKLKNVPMENLKKGFESVEKSIKKVTNSIGRWALALFGIRTAYNFVRSAMSTIASQDQQLNADIQYMKNALAYAIEPIVRWLVDLAKQLLFYVQAIVHALTGKNIFENANKSLKNATGSAKALNKELNKTLANFDEMNTLQDNSASGSGGGVDTVLPSFDLTVGNQIELPKWMQDLLDHKDELIAGLEGIATGLLALKLGISPLKALGIALLITGIALAVQDLIKFINDPSFENFINIIRDIGIAVIGLGIILGNFALTIIGGFVVLETYYAKNEKKFKESFDNIVNYFDTVIKPKWEKQFGIFGTIASDVWVAITRGFQTLADGWVGTLARVISGIKKILKGDLIGGVTEIMKGLTGPVLAPFNAFITFIKELWSRWIKTPIEKLINNIKEKFENLNIGNIIQGKINDIGIKLNNLGNGIRSFFGFAKGGIVYPTKLAVGGVINQPGRGVPLTSAIGGEHGAEGVIPLTDSQQMQLLGEAIGKYITINASITNTMNGRVISRELQKVQNNSDFAFNR